jgi:oligopeptide transport system ATP-binding protein
MKETMAPVLQVKDLQTHFFTKSGVVKAVDGVSFEVAEGEFMGLVGESGCGKSMTALSIMRLVPSPPGRIVAGEILLEGRNVLNFSDAEMRQIRGNHIGMVFQEPMTSLNPVLTIGRQITESLELHLHLDRRQALTRAAELLELVGIPEPAKRLSHYPHQFSGGMRQRVIIAIGLSCNPKLLLADEPTTALDVTVQAQVLELIDKLRQELGLAVLLITHNLGVVARYVDQVKIMYAGKIVEQGSARDIYKSPKHPYTRGLLGSVPRLDDTSSRLIPIEGMPPHLGQLPAGCAFRARCTHAVDRCAREAPQLQSVAPGHDAACWESDHLD